MDAIVVLLTMGLNFIPLLIFAVPFLFLKSSSAKILYKRIYLGLLLFFLVYWVLPSLFQVEVSDLNEKGSDSSSAILFLFIRSFSMFLLYAQYPFVVLPFVFIVAPLYSLVLLIMRLKKDGKEGYIEDFRNLNYEYNKSPRELIQEALNKKDWKKEREIFGGFMILLPISLYLLTVILDLAKVEEQDIASLSGSSTALGWFLEILFVYIATFLYGFELVKASRVSIKGRFIGENLQAKFYDSLRQVGTPISILSILLFIAQKTDSLLLILFFSAYFFMAAFIFIIYIRVFEPISILIFIKLISWKKSRIEKKYTLLQKEDSGENLSTNKDTDVKDKESDAVDIHPAETFSTSRKRSRVLITDIKDSVIYGTLASFVVIVLLFLFGSIMYAFISAVPDGEKFLEIGVVGNTISIEYATLIDILSFINGLQVITVTLLLAYFFYLASKNTLRNGVVTLTYSLTLLFYTILFTFLFGNVFYYNAPLTILGDEAWTTGSPVRIYVGDLYFYTMRTGFLTADLSNYVVLLILASPFTLTRATMNLILWGFLFTFNGKRFRTKSIPKGEGSLVERVTFSNIEGIPSFEDFVSSNLLLITAENVVFTKEEAPELMQLYQTIKESEGILSKDLKLRFTQGTSSNEEALMNLYRLLKILTAKNYITWWTPEFSYVFKKAKLDGLYILYSDGRDLFYYNFNPEESSPVDPALVSGMFSAITSFIRETTRSTDLLRSIDSGDKVVLLEYSDQFPVFIALFADRETADVRIALRTCLERFVERHKDVLKNWSGNVSFFENDKDIVEEAFKNFI